MAQVAIRDGQLRALQPYRCGGCGRMLMKIDPDAVKAGKAIELKCNKCDFMNYLIGTST
jgi:phage FluMu protein Com